MATEDELPEELEKLEITPILPQIKLFDSNLPVQLNPFYDRNLKDAATEKSIKHNTDALAMKSSQSLSRNSNASQNCRRCRYRRASESVLDELKHVSSNTSDSNENARTPPSGLLKQTLKKPTSSSVGGSGNRKFLLREPVLKALQTCLHPHSNVRRKLLASAGTTKTAAGNGSSLTMKGISDFGDLIDECRNLLSEDVDFSGRLNQLCLSNRNSKNFTTMQTSKTQSNNKSRNNKRPIIHTATLSLPSSEAAESNEGHYNAQTMPLIQPLLLGSSNSSTNLQQRNISNLSPEQVSNHARYNTTCSQQAGNSAAIAACDDVTIDELASYFDTFVHIPKKMSTMAEMMYI